VRSEHRHSITRHNIKHELTKTKQRQQVAYGNDSSIVNCRIKIPAVFRGIFGNFAVTKSFYFFLLTFLAETLTMIRATMSGEHSIISSEMGFQNRHSETKLSMKVTHPLNPLASELFFFNFSTLCI